MMTEKAYLKNLTLSLGLISTTVDLMTVQPSVRSGLNRICPDHSIKLSQQYKCPGTRDADEHTVPWNTWNMGMETGDGWQVVPVEERPKAEKVSGLTLTPVPRKELDSATLEGHGLYYAKPSNEHSEKVWALFHKIVSGSKIAFVSRGAIRSGANTDKLWRLTTFNGYLVLREIRFPENIKPSPEAVKAKVDKGDLAMVSTFVDKMSTDWSDFDSEDKMSARIAEWMNTGTEVSAGIASEDAPPAQDLSSMLGAMLESTE
jgi:hypothetical protein